MRLLHETERVLPVSKSQSIVIKVRDNIVKRLDQLLNQALTNSHKKVKTLREQLLKIKDYITTCIFYTVVPAENNFCEQSIRNVKVKLKISTNLRSMKGAENYAIISSIIDAEVLQNKSVWDALKNPAILCNWDRRIITLFFIFVHIIGVTKIWYLYA